VALIFCFDNIILFTMVPFLMALAKPQQVSLAHTALEVVKRIVLHPLIIASALGVASAALHFQPPVALERLMQFLQNAAAPCALFTLGVTVALRPLKKMPWEVPFLTVVKLAVHPILIFLLLSLFGPFDRTWVYTAVLMAALPPALNVFCVRAPIRRLGAAGLERGLDRHAGLRGYAHERDVDGKNRYAAAIAVSVTAHDPEKWQPFFGKDRAEWITLCNRCPAFLSSISPRCCRAACRAVLAEAGAEVIKIERPAARICGAFRPSSTAKALSSPCSIAASRC